MSERSAAYFLIPRAVVASHQEALRDLLAANWEETLPEVHMTHFQIDDAVGGGYAVGDALKDMGIPFLNAWEAGRDGGYEAGVCISCPPQTDDVTVVTLSGSLVPVVEVTEDGDPAPDQLACARTYLAARARFYAFAAAGAQETCQPVSGSD